MVPKIGFIVYPMFQPDNSFKSIGSICVSGTGMYGVDGAEKIENEINFQNYKKKTQIECPYVFQASCFCKSVTI